MPDAPPSQLAREAEQTARARLATLTDDAGAIIALAQIVILQNRVLQRGALDDNDRQVWAQSMGLLAAIVATDTTLAQLLESPQRLIESQWPQPDADGHEPQPLRLGVEKADVDALIATASATLNSAIAAEVTARSAADASEAATRSAADSAEVTARNAAITAAIAAIPDATTTIKGLVLKSAALSASAASTLTNGIGGGLSPTTTLAGSSTFSASYVQSEANNNRLQSLQNDLNLLTQVNNLRSRLEDLIAKLSAAGLQT